MSREITYHVATEPAAEGFSGYALDLPCFATGKTRNEVLDRLREGIAFYLEDFRSETQRPPDPVTTVEAVTIEVA